MTYLITCSRLSLTIGMKWYLKFFNGSTHEQLKMEKTPRYMVDDAAPRRLLRVNPEVGIIFILRDPFERAVSDFAHNLDNDRIKKGTTFEKHVHTKSGRLMLERKELTNSLYVLHLHKWLKYFNREQVLVR